jgi:hypothetical protein
MFDEEEEEEDNEALKPIHIPVLGGGRQSRSL